MAHLEALIREIPSLTHHEVNGRVGPILARPDTVFYTGASTRRAALCNRVFSEQGFTSVPVGDEPIGDLSEVMRFKLARALPFLLQPNRCAVAVAADTQNVTPAINMANGFQMRSWAKPTTPEQIRNMFEDMVVFSQQTNCAPFYIGDSASGILHVNGSAHLVEDRQTSTVELDQNRLARITSQIGFVEYLQALDTFYSQPLYISNGMRVRATDLSGGISLPVLVQMGLVNSIDGVGRGSDQFRTTLRSAVYNVAVGISPRLLESLQVDESIVNDWPWLNGVVDSALSK